MKNIMYGAIAFVVLLAGGVFAWSKIQDQKIKQATVELQQKQVTDKEKAEKEKIDKEKSKMVSEKEYVTNIKKYYSSLKDDYFKAVKIDDLNTDEKRKQLDLVVKDAENLIALETPDQYRSQQNLIIDKVKDIKAAAIIAQDEKDSLSMSLKIGNTDVMMNDVVDLKDLIDKLPVPEP